MKYKIFRVEFLNGINDYDLPTGWMINQILFVTDTQVVLSLYQNEQPPIQQTGLDQVTYNLTYGTTATIRG